MAVAGGGIPAARAGLDPKRRTAKMCANAHNIPEEVVTPLEEAVQRVWQGDIVYVSVFDFVRLKTAIEAHYKAAEEVGFMAVALLAASGFIAAAVFWSILSIFL